MSTTTTTPKPGTYAAEFVERLNKLEADALQLGMNTSELCREAGIARSTPDRWRKTIPKTVQVLTALEEAVEKRRALMREQGTLPAGV